jgi:hypothetical protein
MTPRPLLAFMALWVGLASAAPDATPYPVKPSVKGLQVQMVDDAVALGINHAGINVNLPSLLSVTPKPGQPTLTVDGFTFSFNESYAQGLDRTIKGLSDKGIVVNLILITYRTKNPRLRELAVHPQASETEGTVMAANTVTPEGRACYQAVTEFIAARWSGVDTTHGRVWGWIISNEVNSHWQWHQMGPATTAQVAAQYEDQVRLAWGSLRKHSQYARVYLSLEHHWTAQGNPDPTKACGGRDLLEAFAKKAKERGDFDWNLAFHPYPANLRDPRTWLDKVTYDDQTPKVTFKNLEVLTRKLATPELLYQGQVRRLSFTEQGFNVGKAANAEELQAAGYAFAWEKVKRLNGVDAFLYHRQVDHSLEGGLKLGLWENKPGSIADPGRQRPLWFLVKAAGTSDWDTTAAPYLKTCGFKSWDEVMGK